MIYTPSTYTIKRALKDRAFEIFISHLPVAWLKDFAAGVGVVLIWAMIIFGLVEACGK